MKSTGVYPPYRMNSSLEIDSFDPPRAAVSMILGVVYDKPSLQSNQDPAIAQVNDFIGRIVRAAYPGAHFAEFFRWMKASLIILEAFSALMVSL